MTADAIQPDLERLHKFLARAGVASRRAAEELIRRGEVAVNGRVVTELGTRVGPRDVVTVCGKIVQPPAEKVYIMLNKPSGYVTTVSDEFGRPTVMHLVPGEGRIYPVGRLDADSEGLLLLSNDGDFAYRLTHPRFELDKEYHALVDGSPTESQLELLRRGVSLDGKVTAPAIVERLRKVSVRPGKEATWLRVVIHEGRKRQIRRMVASIGFNTLRLIRVRVGPQRLGDLPSGRFRHLTAAEVERLRGALSLGI